LVLLGIDILLALWGFIQVMLFMQQYHVVHACSTSERVLLVITPEWCSPCVRAAVIRVQLCSWNSMWCSSRQLRYAEGICTFTHCFTYLAVAVAYA
jgi:hypothetical protein